MVKLSMDSSNDRVEDGSIKTHKSRGNTANGLCAKTGERGPNRTMDNCVVLISDLVPVLIYIWSGIIVFVVWFWVQTK